MGLYEGIDRCRKSPEKIRRTSLRTHCKPTENEMQTLSGLFSVKKYNMPYSAHFF